MKQLRLISFRSVSMVEGDFFDKLARIACIMRKNDKPFGGIQLVVCGDFFQLPPVQKDSNVKFAFEAEKWDKCLERTFNLTKVFRQKDQGLYIYSVLVPESDELLFRIR